MKRSRLEIVVGILDAAKKEDSKTSIAYKANLDFKLVDKCLDLLQEQGLMENTLDRYIATEKGKIFSEKAKEITLNLEDPSQTWQS